MLKECPSTDISPGPNANCQGQHKAGPLLLNIPWAGQQTSPDQPTAPEMEHQPRGRRLLLLLLLIVSWLAAAAAFSNFSYDGDQHTAQPG